MEGRIPAVRVYGRVLVDPAAVEEYRARSPARGEAEVGQTEEDVT